MSGIVRLLALLVCSVTAFALAADGARGAAQPNILFVLTDDQRFDTLDVMPATRENFDVAFGTGIATTPNCCPSRASILTGEYAHDHGVMTNGNHMAIAAREAETIAPWLQAQGYYTGFVGKYLNKYRLTEAVPAGWDQFHARVWDGDGRPIGDGHVSFGLRHYRVENGVPRRTFVTYPNEERPTVYSTQLFADLADQFIRDAHDPRHNPEGKPWALFVWPTAPHAPFYAEDLYAAAPVPAWKRPPSYLEADMRDKPREVRRSRNHVETWPFARERTQMLRMLMSVDDLVERLFTTIEGFGERESTWGIYSSDNGYSWGEHWLRGKAHAFEESIRVPFRMAVPGTDAREITDATAANIDIAPTVLAIAGGEAKASFDGASLVDVALGTSERCFCRRSLVIENWETARYRGIRTPWWTYVEWPSGRRELYRLRADPYQLTNVVRSEARVVERLEDALGRLLPE